MIKKIFFTVAAVLGLSACDADLFPYLVKQGFKQGSLLLRSESVEQVLARPGLDPKIESYLRLSQRVLKFAEGQEGMHTRQNYRRFIELERAWVTQIVMAAYPDRLESRLFSYPVVGDLPYKGFFDEVDAVRLEDDLRAQGLDTYRRRVEAFSTAGWLPDPLVSTMFANRARFIELLFHELTHATFYFQSQADFNEAFASWMGFRAALEFIDASPDLPDAEALKKELSADHAYQLKLAGVVKEIIAKGKEFYAKANPLAQREPYFAWIHARLAQDPRFARLAAQAVWNNAFILSLGTYYEWVAPIENYAQAKNLTPKDFLALVTKRGASIIPEIISAK